MDTFMCCGWLSVNHQTVFEAVQHLGFVVDIEV